MKQHPLVDSFEFGARTKRAGFWAIELRDRLPIIPIPLRTPDANARLDFQEVLNHVYDASGYEDSIYSGAPDPDRDELDRAWAESLIPRTSRFLEAGRRMMDVHHEAFRKLAQ